MIPGPFEYHAPKTVAEAIGLLEEYGDEAKVLAGGHSLIPLMKLRLAEPEHLIDINGIADLEYIRESDGFLSLGALTREADLDESELIQTKYSIIKDTTVVIADPQVRNLATVGGNLAHGDPANDHPAVMIALGAELVIQGPDGSRTIAIDDFFIGPLTTALKANEVLTEIRIPTPAKKSGGAYLKLERKVGDYAIVGVAVTLVLDGGGKCTQAGVGLTNVGPTPLRASQAEKALQGSGLSEEEIEQAAQLAAEESQPVGDHRGSEEYKRAMVKELAIRAIRTASQRAEGGQ